MHETFLNFYQVLNTVSNVKFNTNINTLLSIKWQSDGTGKTTSYSIEIFPFFSQIINAVKKQIEIVPLQTLATDSTMMKASMKRYYETDPMFFEFVKNSKNPKNWEFWFKTAVGDVSALPTADKYRFPIIPYSNSPKLEILQKLGLEGTDLGNLMKSTATLMLNIETLAEAALVGGACSVTFMFFWAYMDNAYGTNFIFDNAYYARHRQPEYPPYHQYYFDKLCPNCRFEMEAADIAYKNSLKSSTKYQTTNRGWGSRGYVYDPQRFGDEFVKKYRAYVDQVAKAAGWRRRGHPDNPMRRYYNPEGPVYCDTPTEWQFSFQDPATPIMEGIINLHHHIMFFLIAIFLFFCWILSRILVLFTHKQNKLPSKVTHGVTLEIIWTIIPSIILIFIAIPSIELIYSMDEVIDPAITIKAIGHQWYWSYEYSDYNSSDEDSLAFDSYMIPEEDLNIGQYRLLEVDNPIVLPTNTHVRVIITATDVIHSWAVPSFGTKLDAVPGRLNQTELFIEREGVFYGQCSEICGVNHGFMPIAVKTVPINEYIEWLTNQITAK